MSLDKVITRAWTDSNFKHRLLTDPHAALEEVGVEVPNRVTIKVIENTADTRHLVLPAVPDDADSLSNEELEKVVGGLRNKANGLVLD
jgi:hypothetical protein